MSYLSFPKSTFYVQTVPWSCGYALLRKALQIYDIEYEWELPGYEAFHGVCLYDLFTCFDWHEIDVHRSNRRGLNTHLNKGDIALLSSRPGRCEHVSLIVARKDDRYQVRNYRPERFWQSWFTWEQIQHSLKRSDSDGKGVFLLKVK